ncbi:hypothetical protein [Neptuniibacter sp.]|uniref:hypothetical protein n=1 Tax=Neptuniibacter sp. TaxID=1962643 RepID=UPI003B5C2BC5
MCDKELEAQILADIKAGKCRLIKNPRRKNKLRKRGEDIRWNPYVLGWVWYL